MGRLVLNHSTFVDGLKKVLQKLAKLESIQTVTPAIIGKVKGRSPNLQLRISVPITGGFKLIARKGQTAQEVFIITELSKEDLRKELEKLLKK